MKNEELEKLLRDEFAYTKFDDMHFDKVTLSDFKFAKGKAVAIFTRMYETYSPGRDQDYSGIVFTDGNITTKLSYDRVWDSRGRSFGSDKDEDNYVKKILSFDGDKVEYEVESKKVKEIRI